jgi:DNA-binding response OmpR family regulator
VPFSLTEHTGQKRPSQVKPKILIIEDDVPSGTALRAILSRMGMEVQLATTLAKAMSVIDHVSPDWIVLDLMLPDGDGEQVLRHVRSQMGGHVRVCVTTASSDLSRLKRLTELRPDCVLPKPIDLDALLTQLRQ